MPAGSGTGVAGGPTGPPLVVRRQPTLSTGYIPSPVPGPHSPNPAMPSPLGASQRYPSQRSLHDASDAPASPLYQRHVGQRHAHPDPHPMDSPIHSRASPTPAAYSRAAAFTGPLAPSLPAAAPPTPALGGVMGPSLGQPRSLELGMTSEASSWAAPPLRSSKVAPNTPLGRLIRFWDGLSTMVKLLLVVVALVLGIFVVRALVRGPKGTRTDHLYIAAEVAHFFGLALLIWRISTKRSVAGLSLHMQIVTALFLSLRLFVSLRVEVVWSRAHGPFGESVAWRWRVLVQSRPAPAPHKLAAPAPAADPQNMHALLDFSALTLTLWVIFMMLVPLSATYKANRDLDGLHWYYLAVPCAVLALVVHPHITKDRSATVRLVDSVFWAMALYLEAVSNLPQLYMFQARKGSPLSGWSAGRNGVPDETPRTLASATLTTRRVCRAERQDRGALHGPLLLLPGAVPVPVPGALDPAARRVPQRGVELAEPGHVGVPGPVRGGGADGHPGGLQLPVSGVEHAGDAGRQGGRGHRLNHESAHQMQGWMCSDTTSQQLCTVAIRLWSVSEGMESLKRPDAV